jgi:cyclopropane fatty-acyl-phospholipid synthase-like methyltransferase
MIEPAPFDVLAAGYDAGFSQSLTGRAQRNVSRVWLQHFLLYKGPLRILEINCGTGDDALWLASLGHYVVATDQSAHMIQEAEQKSAQADLAIKPTFIAAGFDELGITLGTQRFDLVFSNFAGLNCIAPHELSAFTNTLQELLTDEGHLAAVIFGKYCWWETCYYLFKADTRNAFRRWKHKPAMARLASDVFQPVFYYSVAQFVKNLRPLLLREKRPVGLFIPPSYMEHSMQKHTRFFGLLVKLEKMIRRSSVGSSFADHTYILLQKHVP